MVSLEILRDKFGVSAETWKTALEERGRETSLNLLPVGEDGSKDEKLSIFVDRIRERVDSERQFNMDPKRWHLFALMDQLWSQARQQVTPTLLSRLVQNYKTTEDAYNSLKAIGYDMDKLLVETGRNNAKGEPIKEISSPAFFNILVPLMPAYLQIRRAKLTNERNVNPMIKYKPVANTKKNRVKAEVLTSRVDLSCRQYNGIDVLDQSNFQMLLYGYGIAFPRETWHVEKQARSKAKKGEDGDQSTGGDIAADMPDISEERKKELDGCEFYTVREGIRRHFPHPSRAYWDKNHNLRTLNTDTGCQYCGYFKAIRFSELKDNKAFYNLDRVTSGADWWTSNTAFLNSFMGQCVGNFPNYASIEGYGQTTSDDREAWLAANSSYVGAKWDQHAVMVYEHFEKFIPADVGLGSYPYPIWGRFVLAGDGTIIHAMPLGYRPALVNQDRGNEGLIHDTSLAMKLAPYQDAMSNLLSQYLLAVKQNLTNITLVDKNVIDEDKRSVLVNLGEKMWRTLNIFSFDGRALQRAQREVTKAIYSHRFPALDTNSILQSMRTIIDIMERVLQFSSQEVAQAASHEQTKQEIDVIQNTSTNILSFTGMAPDEFLMAMGAQEYEAGMNFWEDDLLLSISRVADVTKKDLKEMGITTLEDAWEPGEKIAARMYKSALAFDLFVSVAPLHEREIDAQMAQSMATFVRDILTLPDMAKAVGVEQTIMLANEIARRAGIPLPEPIKDTGSRDQNEDAQELLAQIQEPLLRMIKEGIQPLQEATQRNTIQIQAVREALNINPESNGQNNELPGDPGQGGRITPMVAST